MKYLSLLSITLLSGPVIKATPPLPSPEVLAKNYRDIDAAIVEKYDDPNSFSGNGKTYKVHVKNTGEGYLQYVGLFFPKESEGSRYQSYSSDCEGFISNKSVIAPNQEQDYYISANYDADSIDDFYVEGAAYYEFTDEVTITGDLKLTGRKIDYSDGKCYTYNAYHMKFSKENGQYSYGAIIKVNVNEQDYYFAVSSYDHFSFRTNIPLSEKEEIEFEVVKVLKSEYSHYEESKTNYGFLVALPILVPILIAALFIGLLAAIFIIVVRCHKKH